MSDEIKQIKDKIDITDLIAEYIEIKPAGTNKKACCPFHNEKTPSLMINSERQSWHCFGCGKGGDIFTFVEEMEGMEFKEALKFLAEKAGVELTNNFKVEINSNKKNRLKDINLEATRFYHNFLLQMDSSSKAREYLKNRGLSEDTTEEWQIGYIPDQWDLLTKYLFKKGFSVDDLVDSGLTIKKESNNSGNLLGFYDRFRDRIMFPIWDVHNNVIGFTGRILKEKENSGGKYVNTPQTELFDKSNLVFALNKAKKAIKEEDLIVLVEGQMDVISCHQVGMKNVVATSGTALTEKQIKLLKRYSSNINMAFDSDKAGIAAARRGIAIALADGMNVKIIEIPEGQGKDPDECIKKNKDIWFEVVKNSRPIMDWYFDLAFKNKNLADPKDKQKIANELLEEIKNIPFALERDHWMQKLSSLLTVEVKILEEDLNRIKNLEKKKANFKEETIEKSNIFEKENDFIRILKVFLMLILKFPYLLEEDRINLPFEIKKENILSPNIFLDLYEKIFLEYTNNHKIDPLVIREKFTRDNENIVDILIMQVDLDFFDFTKEDIKKEFFNLLKILKEKWLNEEKKRLELSIKKAHERGDREMEDKLTLEFINLFKK